MTKEEALRIAPDFWKNPDDIQIIRTGVRFNDDSNLWVVGFELDVPYDPGFLLIEIDPDTGKPSYKHYS
jgi:hypothetical protein